MHVTRRGPSVSGALRARHQQPRSQIQGDHTLPDWQFRTLQQRSRRPERDKPPPPGYSRGDQTQGGVQLWTADDAATAARRFTGVATPTKDHTTELPLDTRVEMSNTK